jgi:hypothetical protein
MSESSIGGYRQPKNPAPVSGPGSLSQRTDGGATEGMSQPQQSYSGFAYGENKAVNEQQGGAPLAGDSFNMPNLGTFNTTNRSIYDGINYGDGPGTEALMNQPMRQPNIIDTLRSLVPFDSSGDIELILNATMDNGGTIQ